MQADDVPSRWSSELVMAEHKDFQASGMALDCNGENVLLAGRRCLAIKNLNDPSNVLHKVFHDSKYEVGAVEWNPHVANKEICALSSNQKLEILTCKSGYDLVQTHVIKAHSRVISDLNWHHYDPNLLASCSIDTHIHFWDIRDPRKPSSTLTAIEGSSGVRWNRVSKSLLATAHDGDVKIWDFRKLAQAVEYISGHLGKVHAVDWSYSSENHISSCSQDCTVKIYDYTKPRRPQIILRTTSPVWRARYTPFGEGIVTVIVPQIHRGGENSLLLWSLGNDTAPVHTFVGHTDVILEFAWRKYQQEDSEYQLVTWSRDQTLRIWRIDLMLQKLCGADCNSDSSLDNTEADKSMKTLVIEPAFSHPLQQASVENNVHLPSCINNFVPEEQLNRDSDVVTSQPKTLQQEFSLLNLNIPNVTMETMDAVRRTCTVTAARNCFFVVLIVTFPSNYPYNAIPAFQFGQGSSLDPESRSKLIQVLQQTALQRVRKNKSCLEPCLRQLVLTLDQMTEQPENKHQLRYQTPLLDSAMLGSFQDAYIPFPRTSGARFCSAACLVCFGYPRTVRRSSNRIEASTPRALSAFGASTFTLGSSPTNNSQYSLIYPSMAQAQSGDSIIPFSSFYFHDRGKSWSRSRGLHHTNKTIQRNSSKKSFRAIVTIYNIAPLCFLSRELGEKYLLNPDDIPGACTHNSTIAALDGRPDLVQTWTIASFIATPITQTGIDNYEEIPWAHHPLGRALVESLIDHYAEQCDIQTAAMLSCIFSPRVERYHLLRSKQSSKCVNVSPGGSPYHTIHQVDTSLESWNYPMLKQNRSNSWSESLDEFKITSNIMGYTDMTAAEYRKNRILDEKKIYQYDCYKRIYAEILHRWHLLGARAQVLKFLSSSPEPYRGIECFTECQFCHQPVRSPSCSYCKQLTFQCVICHLSVRGLYNFCLVCGHGGHIEHLMTWFQNQTVCPSGCGCNCPSESMRILE